MEHTAALINHARQHLNLNGPVEIFSGTRRPARGRGEERLLAEREPMSTVRRGACAGITPIKNHRTLVGGN